MKSLLFPALQSKLVISVSSILLFSSSAWGAEQSHWQQLMEQGTKARLNVQYEEAERAFQESAKEAEGLGRGEQYLSYMNLADTLDDQGKYSEEEKVCRDWVQACAGREAYQYLANVLEYLRKHDESKQVRHDQQMPTSAGDDRVKAWMKGTLQPSIRKNWHPPHRPSSNSALVEFCFVGSGTPTAIFVLESTDDKAQDKAGVNAVAATLIDVPNFVKCPAVVAFSFDYNAITRMDPQAYQLGQHNRLQRKYSDLRRRILWQEKNIGGNHVALAYSMSAAADVLSKLDDQESAIKAYERSLAIWDAEHICTSGTYSSLVGLGDLLLKKKKYSEAEPILRRAKEVAAEFYTPDSVELQKRHEKLSEVLKKLHKSDDTETVKK